MPTPSSHANWRRQNQSGAALLMVIFMVASLILLTSVAVSSQYTRGRREMEEEMVWRGQQYQRAIGLYYMKFGHYPTKVDDLTQLTNGMRFLRKAYTDPMNKVDGSWRFIYAGPNGQLIGSLTQSSILQGALGVPAAGGMNFLGGSMQGPAPPGAQPGQPGAGAASQPGQQPTATSDSTEAQPQPLEGDVIGGNIAGVGSKIKQPYFRVYNGGDTYQKWEFIWSPLMGQMQVPQQQPVQPGAPGVALPNGAQPQQSPTQPAGAAPGAQPPAGAPPSDQPTTQQQ